MWVCVYGWGKGVGATQSKNNKQKQTLILLTAGVELMSVRSSSLDLPRSAHQRKLKSARYDNTKFISEDAAGLGPSHPQAD